MLMLFDHQTFTSKAMSSVKQSNEKRNLCRILIFVVENWPLSNQKL